MVQGRYQPALEFLRKKFPGRSDTFITNMLSVIEGNSKNYKDSYEDMSDEDAKICAKDTATLLTDDTSTLKLDELCKKYEISHICTANMDKRIKLFYKSGWYDYIFKNKDPIDLIVKSSKKITDPNQIATLLGLDTCDTEELQRRLKENPTFQTIKQFYMDMDKERQNDLVDYILKYIPKEFLELVVDKNKLYSLQNKFGPIRKQRHSNPKKRRRSIPKKRRRNKRRRSLRK